MIAQPMNTGIQISLWCQLALFVLSVAALPFDTRQVLGVNPWLKPIKFEVSVAIFLLTVGLLLTQVTTIHAPDTWQALLANWIGWTIGISMIVENTLIALQSLRGIRSHTNYDGLFNRGVFGAMGLGVLCNTIALGLLLLLFCDFEAQWRWAPAMIAGARLGLIVLLWGSFEGVAMVTRQQHTVGASDSGDGIPLVNWSTTHGDLRVAHFFALHAIQIFLVMGFLIARSRIPSALQILGMVLFAMVYLGACHLLFKQALAGKPFTGAMLLRK